MLRTALVTVVTRNYLHYARVLAESCERWQPDMPLTVVLADSLPASHSLDQHLARVLLAEQLGIDDWNRFTFKYTPFELCCALKPHAMQALFAQGFERVVFIDSDLALYGPLASIEQALQTHSIALVPHLHRPLPRDGRKPLENNFLNAGTFNGGLVACCNDPQGQQFLQWWGDHFCNDCYVDVAGGVFVDQKWLNLAPGLFPSLAIVRQPGCNAGHWTLSQFPLSGDREQGYCVGDYPLGKRFISATSSPPIHWSLCTASRASASEQPRTGALVRDYHGFATKRSRAVRVAEVPIRPTLRWYTDPTRVREAVRRNHKELRGIKDPSMCN
ncbi:MAG: hypothetical protein R3C56_11895 [Pirellulaceae bacterium]